MAPRRHLVVHKFGGASLADAAAIARALSIVRKRRPERAVVVVSAMAGVTDALLAIGARAEGGDDFSLGNEAARLRSVHAEAARAVVPAGRRREELLAAIEDSFAELEMLGRGLAIVRELSPRTRDHLVSRGERLSARIFAAGLEAAGCPAVFVDALDVIRTDGQFGNAAADLPATDRAARKILVPLLRAGTVPVVPGYLGAAPGGQLATLGRGGTDVTAVLLGRALGASEVSLWKDVPGLLTADPRAVPDARLIPQLNVREAAELAYHGAKVLHPRALIPIFRRDVPLRIRPFADPPSPGTEISRRRTLTRYPVKALSVLTDQALLTVTGNGMLGVPGIAARTFSALHKGGISVSLITQASSEHSISFSVPSAGAPGARAALLEAFAGEISRREIDGVEVRAGVSTVAVVGLGMAGTPGIATRVFSALSAGRINVVAIAQGSSELNISVVVDARDAAAAQRRIHAAFQLDKIGGGAATSQSRADLVLLGFGQIGRALAGLVARRKEASPRLRIVAVIDSGGSAFESRGFSPGRLGALAAWKGRKPLSRAPGGRAGAPEDALDLLASHALSRPILVDCTAADTTPLLRRALRSGMDVVLANKRPLSGPAAEAEGLTEEAERHGRRILHEATVGAGLPIIDTYAKLVESGDRVRRIEASLSGTLGFLLTEIGRGRPFSQALQGAMSKGYTEPDPRDDLSGLDVARKALILGRLAGYRGELRDVRLEPLLSAAGPLKEFLSRLETWDPSWAERVAAARGRGRVLRYLARVTPRAISVGLVAVGAHHPFASLRGTDNQVAFVTRRYGDDNPLVIRGPGAGLAVTAAGILNDVLKLLA